MAIRIQALLVFSMFIFIGIALAGGQAPSEEKGEMPAVSLSPDSNKSRILPDKTDGLDLDSSQLLIKANKESDCSGDQHLTDGC